MSLRGQLLWREFFYTGNELVPKNSANMHSPTNKDERQLALQLQLISLLIIVVLSCTKLQSNEDTTANSCPQSTLQWAPTRPTFPASRGTPSADR